MQNPPTFLHSTRVLTCFVATCIILYEGQCPYLRYFLAECLHSETPAVLKLPWLSLKPKLNEIWMCSEWIREIEWAKYCLHRVLREEVSDWRKAKYSSKFSTIISRPEVSLYARFKAFVAWGLFVHVKKKKTIHSFIWDKNKKNCLIVREKVVTNSKMQYFDRFHFRSTSSHYICTFLAEEKTMLQFSQTIKLYFNRVEKKR